jgi:hypothetical protein
MANIGTLGNKGSEAQRPNLKSSPPLSHKTSRARPALDTNEVFAEQLGSLGQRRLA